MSYLKKIEEDYNNGIISLDEINEKREIYYKLGKDQKVEINTKYASVLKENNNVEPVSNDKTDIPNTSFFSSYYFLSILVNSIFLESISTDSRKTSATSSILKLIIRSHFFE